MGMDQDENRILALLYYGNETYAAVHTCKVLASAHAEDMTDYATDEMPHLATIS